MRGNQINFKLVHFSDKLLNEYYTLIQNGKVRMPDYGKNGSKRNATMSFLQTEDSQKNELRALFEAKSTAKMIVDGFVVQNIVLQQ